jgi:hypothetical protein
MSKSIIPVLVCALLAAAPARAAGAPAFPKDHWAYFEYEYMSQKGFLPQGAGANPVQTATRAETLGMLSLMTGLPADDASFAGATGADTDTVTRQELFRLAGQYLNATGRAFRNTGDLPEFSDWDEIGDREKSAAEPLARAGIISGRGDGKLSPLDAATLAETVKVLAQTELNTAVRPGALPIEYDETTRVEFQNGNNGAKTPIQDEEKIKAIFGTINDASYTFARKKDVPGRGGWSMRVRVYAGGALVFDYTVSHGIWNSRGQHRMDVTHETALADLLHEYYTAAIPPGGALSQPDA